MFAVFVRFAVIIIADTPVRNMNREQRERYEQGETGHRNFRRFCVTTVGRMEERGNAPVAGDLRQGKEGSLWAKTF